MTVAIGDNGTTGQPGPTVVLERNDRDLPAVAVASTIGSGVFGLPAVLAVGALAACLVWTWSVGPL